MNKVLLWNRYFYELYSLVKAKKMFKVYNAHKSRCVLIFNTFHHIARSFIYIKEVKTRKRVLEEVFLSLCFFFWQEIFFEGFSKGFAFDDLLIKKRKEFKVKHLGGDLQISSIKPWISPSNYTSREPPAALHLFDLNLWLQI